MRITVTLLLLLGVATCYAQYPKDRGVSQMDKSWDVAWQKSHSSTQERLAWIPKARKNKWTVSDQVFLTAEKEVEQKWLALKNQDKTVEFFWQRAAEKPTAVNNFAWGYAEWLRYTRTKIARPTYKAQLAMNKTFVPSFRYIRTLFLLPSQPEYPKTLEPIAQKMLSKAPKDLRIRTKAAEILMSIPTTSARRQSEKLHRELIAVQPNSYRWSKLGTFYSRWWRWNDGIATTAKNATERKVASSRAQRDAKSAIAAWRKSVALSSDPKWRDIEGPRLISNVESWLQKNRPSS